MPLNTSPDFLEKVTAALPLVPKPTAAFLKWMENPWKEADIYISKQGRAECTHCCHVWKETSKTIPKRCPNCKLPAAPAKSKQKPQWDMHLHLIQVIGGIQVVRTFRTKSRCYFGKREHVHREIHQSWISERGEILYNTKARFWLGENQIMDFGNKSMRLVDEAHWEGEPTGIYPIKQTAPYVYELISDKLISISTNLGQDLSLILRTPCLETLIKHKQWRLYQHLARLYKAKNLKADIIWDAYKIARRHGFVFPDISLWTDYLDVLIRMGKDATNPSYVAPADFNKAYTDLRAEEEAFNRRNQQNQRQQQASLRLDELKTLYKSSAPSCFFGDKTHLFATVFEKDGVQVRLLNSFDDYKKEGDTLKHCVFTNQYYKKTHSLVFSASVNAARIETIEVCRATYDVLQAYGKHNKPSPQHETILSLFKENKKQLRKLDKTRKAA